MQNLSKDSAERVICMSNTHHGHVECIKCIKVAKISQFMLQVSLSKCREESDLYSRSTVHVYLRYTSLLILCDIFKILAIAKFWKWYDDCINHELGCWSWWPNHFTKEWPNGFSTSWECSICEVRLHYPGNRTQTYSCPGRFSYHNSVCWFKKHVTMIA